MTPRSIRRAAERKARKLARKQQQLSPEQPQAEPAPEISAARLEANRANAPSQHRAPYRNR